MGTEAASSKYRRKLRMTDNAIFNAIAELIPYYGLLIRADPVLAAVCEQLILEWEESRRKIHFIYLAAWRSDHPQFSTIGAAADIIAKERTFGNQGEGLCLAYSKEWDRMAKESYHLLEKRAVALHRQLGSRQSRPDPSSPLSSPESLPKSRPLKKGKVLSPRYPEKK